MPRSGREEVLAPNPMSLTTRGPSAPWRQSSNDVAGRTSRHRLSSAGSAQPHEDRNVRSLLPVAHLENVRAGDVCAGGMVRRPVRESQKCDRRGRRSVLAVSNTPSVSLRPRTDDDLDLLFYIAADLDTWEERNPQAPRPLTRDRFDARLARTADNDGPEAAMSFVIDVDGAAVGSASLFDFDLFARHAEAGISLVQNARGRGIGTAAIVQLVEFGFVRHNLRRIHLQAIASNIAAIRAYEKAGFVIEGRQRQHAWVRGTYEDIVRMGILCSEQTSSA